ncbi:MAG: ATP-binding protein [Alphaproteobacteria bacterium]|nr:ATP-binding protein [Alphaproteobacteria bacterium]
MNLIDLIKQKESNFLDFKAQWYTDNADLLFDILCLANSSANFDRYLVIGVEDKTHCIKDVSTDPHRKSEENLHNLIQNASFNIKPIVNIETIKIENKEIDILIIKNTRDKPYFLTKDKETTGKNGKRIIRAGVIYTRDGAVNTPIQSTASEYQIAKMWQERFGLTLSPIERLNTYIKNTEKWKSITIDGDVVRYYEDFPEFTITFHHIDTQFEYEWAEAIAESSADNLYLKYHTTVLKELFCSHVDGGRYFIVSPNFCWIYYTSDYSDIQIIKFGEGVSDKGESIEKLIRGEYQQSRIFYETIGSFNYCVDKLYNTPDTLGYFFKCGTHIPVLLLNETDDIYDACRKEFLHRIKSKI